MLLGNARVGQFRVREATVQPPLAARQLSGSLAEGRKGSEAPSPMTHDLDPPNILSPRQPYPFHEVDIVNRFD